jgi:hypothetical protein
MLHARVDAVALAAVVVVDTAIQSAEASVPLTMLSLPSARRMRPSAGDRSGLYVVHASAEAPAWSMMLWWQERHWVSRTISRRRARRAVLVVGTLFAVPAVL